MKILTSPAKLMKVGVSSEFIEPTEPQFIEDSAFIQSYLKEKTPNFLAELMELSPKLADENWERNQNWKKNPSENESAPALLAFIGEVYRGLDAPSLDKKAIDYLQEHYSIIGKTKCAKNFRYGFQSSAGKNRSKITKFKHSLKMI